MQSIKTRKRQKTAKFALLMAVALSLPIGASAQQEGGGLFGRGQNEYNNPGEVSTSGVLNQGFGSNGSTLFNQGFGGTNGGITNQGFAVPIGSGLLVLMATGAGYASIKKNKKNKKSNQQKRH